MFKILDNFSSFLLTQAVAEVEAEIKKEEKSDVKSDGDYIHLILITALLAVFVAYFFRMI